MVSLSPTAWLLRARPAPGSAASPCSCLHLCCKISKKDGLGVKRGEKKKKASFTITQDSRRIPAILETDRGLGELHRLKACKMVRNKAGRQHGKLLPPAHVLAACARRAVKSKAKHAQLRLPKCITNSSEDASVRCQIKPPAGCLFSLSKNVLDKSLCFIALLPSRTSPEGSAYL